MSNKENPKQKAARKINEIKAFTCRWYTRFDQRQIGNLLLPFLTEPTIEFMYPSQTFTNTKEFAEFSAKSATTTEQTAHELGEIHVRELSEDLYEVICEHIYNMVPKGATTWTSLKIASRMRVQTSFDSTGENIKIAAYKVLVLPEQLKNQAASIDAKSLVLANQAKTFVYDWFALIDAGDADGLTRLLTEDGLDVAIFGNQFLNPKSFVDFLMLQANNQNWSSHEAFNITVDASNLSAPEVRFYIRFSGKIANGPEIKVSNITNWGLKLEGSVLKLKKYRLELL
jgi:ketosteroid isomerase-like protein